MARIDRLANRWDEDERAPPRAIGETLPKEPLYVPVTQIMKEFYQEEKDKLYCYGGYSPKASWSYDEIVSEHSVSSYNSIEDSETTTDENTQSDTISNEDEEAVEDPLVRIVEDAVYKKFSYV